MPRRKQKPPETTYESRPITPNEVAMLERIDTFLRFKSRYEINFLEDQKMSFSRYGTKMHITLKQADYIAALHARVEAAYNGMLGEIVITEGYPLGASSKDFCSDNVPF